MENTKDVPLQEKTPAKLHMLICVWTQVQASFISHFPPYGNCWDHDDNEYIFKGTI
jgi:hypothetical protein